MKKAVFLALILALFSIFWSCETLTGPKDSEKAKVVMVEGPTFVDGSASFSYKGRVQNQGKAKAGFTRIIIYIKNSAGTQLAQGETNLVDVALEPNEIAAWEVIFADGNRTLRNSMDQSKTAYEIKWE